MAIGETVITIVGNLTADPELRATGQGAQVASFTIANTPRQYNRQTGQYEDGDALFLRCSAWNDLAQHCVRSLAKACASSLRADSDSTRIRRRTARTAPSWSCRSTSSAHRSGTRRRRSTASAARTAPSTATPPLHSRRPSTPAPAAGANSRSRRNSPRNRLRLRMIRGARRQTASHHSENSARPTASRTFKDKEHQ